MYGFLHVCLLRYLGDLPNGRDLIKQVLELAGPECNPHNNFHAQFSDEQTLALISAAAKVVGCPIDEILTGMGSIQLDTFTQMGYLPLMKSLGADFYEFLENIDTLHQNLVQSYPNMTAPSLRPRLLEDGRIVLHYYSSRNGMAAYAISVLKVMAKEIFKRRLIAEHVSKRADGNDHDVFVLRAEDGLPLRSQRATTHTTMPLAPEKPLSPGDFDRLFPWHVAFNADMKIVSLGQKLASLFPEIKSNPEVHELVKLIRPALMSFDELKHFNRTSFLLIVRDETYVQLREERKQAKARHNPPAASTCPMHQAMAAVLSSSDADEVKIAKPAMTKDDSGAFEAYALHHFQNVASNSSLESLGNAISEASDFLYLKGEILFTEENICLLAGTPIVSRVEDLHNRGLGISDLPVHANCRELLFSSMHSSATIGTTQTLETTLAELEKAQSAMELERQKSYELLHAILPKPVAQALIEGKKTPAERYGSASIMFSDICGFTKISSSVQPTQVMNMLNDLFSRFDELCEKHGVYKVETIGDAFMAVAGVPESSERHAQMIADFALDAMAAAREVKSPIDGSPLKIRIGLHAGSVMAGVVGSQRPRYCLFGDTVNVASRMESTSVPGCIQISSTLMSELQALGGGYQTKFRGDVEVKGKGTLDTFFLIGKTKVDEHLVPADAVFEAARRQSQAIHHQHHQQLALVSSGIPAAVAEPVTFFDILVHEQVEIKKPQRLAAVAGSTKLAELLASLYPTANDGESPQWRLYADDDCTELLVTQQTVKQLVDSEVCLPDTVKHPRTGRTVKEIHLFAHMLRKGTEV